jgi:hypothetical protein
LPTGHGNFLKLPDLTIAGFDGYESVHTLIVPDRGRHAPLGCQGIDRYQYTVRKRPRRDEMP